MGEFRFVVQPINFSAIFGGYQWKVRCSPNPCQDWHRYNLRELQHPVLRPDWKEWQWEPNCDCQIMQGSPWHTASCWRQQWFITDKEMGEIGAGLRQWSWPLVNLCLDENMWSLWLKPAFLSCLRLFIKILSVLQLVTSFWVCPPIEQQKMKLKSHHQSQGSQYLQEMIPQYLMVSMVSLWLCYWESFF